MYQFAVVALLGLVALKVADLLIEAVPSLARARTLLTFTVAVAAVVALDYSLFSGFGIGVREAWMGTWGTGLIVGSLATAWKVAFGYLGSTEAGTTVTTRDERPRIAA